MRRWSTDPHVRVISFTGSTAVGRSIGELAGRHLKRAHLELGGNSALLILDDADVEQAVGADRLGVVPQPGPDLHDHRPLLRRRRDLRRLRRPARREGRPPAGRRPGHRAGRTRAGHRRAVARQDPRPGHGERRPGRAPGRGRRVRPALLPADRAGRGPTQLAGLHRGGVRPGRTGHQGLLGRGSGTPGLGGRLRAVARHRHSRRDARTARSPSRSRPASCTSTTRP